MTILTDLAAEPDLKPVYHRMGFKPGKAAIPEGVKPLVDKAIRLGQQLVEPRGCYDYRKIQHREPHVIEVDGAFEIESEKVFARMAGCRGLYLVAVTLGSKLDRKVSQLSSSGEVTLAFLLNAYGAEAAEALMKRLDQVISERAKEQRMETTRRYSPGYGDWPLTAQRDLLKALQADRIGIQLTEHCLMIPEKSVSAIIGIRPQGQRNKT